MKAWVVLFLLFGSGHIFATCGENFDEVTTDCISKDIAKFKPFNKKIEAITKGDIYFYQTNTGALGKLIVNTATINIRQ